MLKTKCCLYVIISILFFPITICNLLIESPSYNVMHQQYIERANFYLEKKTRPWQEVPGLSSEGAIPRHRVTQGRIVKRDLV